MCLAAHDQEFPRWTPVAVKLLLPPRQSRGDSHCRLGNRGDSVADAETVVFTRRESKPTPLLVQGWPWQQPEAEAFVEALRARLSQNKKGEIAP